MHKNFLNGVSTSRSGGYTRRLLYKAKPVAYRGGEHLSEVIKNGIRALSGYRFFIIAETLEFKNPKSLQYGANQDCDNTNRRNIFNHNLIHCFSLN